VARADRSTEPMQPADEVLMERVRDGDRTAFEDLIDRHEQRVFTFFFRRIHDAGDAEDLTLEVWVKLYQARASYRPDAKFTTYLYRIARNHWIDHMRVRGARRRQTVSLDRDDEDRPSLVDALESNEALPETRQYGAELLGKIREGVSHLSVGEVEVFNLAIFDEVPYGDISRILGIPVGTVKSRMHTSMHKLRRWLEREGIRP
jgi:RNA polymerase sigma-70 factor (ECF subfamily)